MIDETVDEIRQMRTHSSSVVAVKAARALESLFERDFATVEEYERALERNSNALRGASPSHASLWTTQQEIVDTIRNGNPDTVEEAKDLTRLVIDRVVNDVEGAKLAAAKNAASDLEDGETLLTHDYSTSVLKALELAVADGKTFDVYVTEARPRYLGRKCARELASIDGITPRLLVDSAMGYYLPECDRVCLGMDCIVDDTLYNRVGTYPLAATAADAGVPVYVIGSSAKLVRKGFRFENEFRATSEVLREPATGFEVCNPAYDATPMTLVDHVISDDGLS